MVINSVKVPQTVRFPTKFVNIDNISNCDKNITFTQINGHTHTHAKQ